MLMLNQLVGFGVSGSPLDAMLYNPARVGPSISLSDGGATATSTGPSLAQYDRAFTYKLVSGSVYVEMVATTVSGGQCDFSLIDDSGPAPTTSATTRPGDGEPGFTWRSQGDGFSCTTPGAFASGDVLRAKLVTSSATVALALNGGAFAADATWAAGSTWRVMSAWFQGSSGAFSIPAAPSYGVPAGFTWVGDL